MKHLALLLSRLDQSVDDYERQSREAVEKALEPATDSHLEMLPTLGRWDALCYCSFGAGQPSGDWLNFVEWFPSFKKIDVQYAFGKAEEVEPFEDDLKKADDPLLLLLYLRVRDEVAMGRGVDALEQVHKRLKRICGKTKCLIARTRGWPDFALLLLGHDIEALLDIAEKTWVLPLGELAKQKGEKLPGDTGWLLEKTLPKQPVFSRSFSVLAYRREKLGDVKGDLHAPCVHLRTRLGADAVIQRALKDLKQADAKSLHPRLAGVEVHMSEQLGADDAIVRFWAPEQGSRIDVPANALLPWYNVNLLPALRPLIHASELRLGLKPGLGADYVRDPSPVPPVKFLGPLVDGMREANGTRPLGGALRSMSRMINWGMSHDALYRSVADLYLHTYALAQAVEEGDPAGTAPLRVDDRRAVSALSRIFSEAIAQRLQGSYYDMMSDSPEVVLELSGNLSRAILALWAIQDILLDAVAVTTHAEPRAYWLVFKEGEGGACSPFKDTFVFRISSAFLFNLRDGLYAVGHEIGHAALWLYLEYAERVYSQPAERYEHAPEPPAWVEALLRTGLTNRERNRLAILREIFADAFSCLLVLDGDAAEVQRGLRELAEPWLASGGPELPRFAFWMRMLFASWMRRMLEGSGSVLEWLESGSEASLLKPQTSAEVNALLDETIERCKEEYGRECCDVIKKARALLTTSGLLEPSMFVHFNALFKHAAALVLFAHQKRRESDPVLADVRWLREQTRLLRTGSRDQAAGATNHLYDSAMKRLARRLNEIRKEALAKGWQP